MSTTPKVYTSLPSKSSSLGTISVTEKSPPISKETPVKITTIRFNYPFLTSESSTTYSNQGRVENSTQAMNEIELTTSNDIGGHARPQIPDNALFVLTPPPGT